MRRHHFLNLKMLEPQENRTGRHEEGIRERRRSSQISCISSEDPLHKHLPQLFSGYVPGRGNDDGSSEGSNETENEGQRERDAEEAAPGFLGRVTSYSRLMHAHTQCQLNSPSTGTLPAYSKTMHAFTMNQLQFQRSKSETSSPHIGPKLKTIPKKQTEIKALNYDELPHGPVNTPGKDDKYPGNDKIEQIDLEPPVGRRRSLTDPSAVRDFAAVKERDLANIRPVAV